MQHQSGKKVVDDEGEDEDDHDHVNDEEHSHPNSYCLPCIYQLNLPHQSGKKVVEDEGDVQENDNVNDSTDEHLHDRNDMSEICEDNHQQEFDNIKQFNDSNSRNDENEMRNCVVKKNRKELKRVKYNSATPVLETNCHSVHQMKKNRHCVVIDETPEDGSHDMTDEEDEEEFDASSDDDSESSSNDEDTEEGIENIYKNSFSNRKSKSDKHSHSVEDYHYENLMKDEKEEKVAKGNQKSQDMKKNGKSDDSTLTTPVLVDNKPVTSSNFEESKTAVIEKVTETQMAARTPTPTSNSLKILPSLFIGLVIGFGFLM